MWCGVSRSATSSSGGSSSSAVVQGTCVPTPLVLGPTNTECPDPANQWAVTAGFDAVFADFVVHSACPPEDGWDYSYPSSSGFISGVGIIVLACIGSCVGVVCFVSIAVACLRGGVCKRGIPATIVPVMGYAPAAAAGQFAPLFPQGMQLYGQPAAAPYQQQQPGYPPAQQANPYAPQQLQPQQLQPAQQPAAPAPPPPYEPPAVGYGLQRPYVYQAPDAGQGHYQQALPPPHQQQPQQMQPFAAPAAGAVPGSLKSPTQGY